MRRFKYCQPPVLCPVSHIVNGLSLTFIHLPASPVRQHTLLNPFRTAESGMLSADLRSIFTASSIVAAFFACHSPVSSPSIVPKVRVQYLLISDDAVFTDSTSFTSSAKTTGDFFSSAASANTFRTSPDASPITTGIPSLIIPAFSEAIFSRVSPRNCVWSNDILVIILIMGVMIFVLSSRPPSPVSITATSTLRFAKNSNAITIVSSKKEGRNEESMAMNRFTKSTTSSSVIGLPFTLIRSRKSTRCGEV